MLPADLRVLVVDDHQTMRGVIVEQLRSLGLTSIIARSNGAEALRVLQEQGVDLVLSDWDMPVMSGLDLLKAMRVSESWFHIPFMMVTADADRNRVETAVRQGVSNLLVKPYTSAMLESRIARALAWKPSSPIALVAAEPDVAVASEALPVEPKLPTMLIVDDLPDNLRLLAQLFKDEFRVRLANNGHKALSLCFSDDPPDIVLLDVMMPNMDGFEVAKAMRDHPCAANIPIIFVTALTGDEARLKGMDLGAVDFITKPVNPDLLQPRVRNFMRYVQLRKQLQADYDEIVAQAQLRDTLEAVTRHDLKAPLAVVIGLAQSMAENIHAGPQKRIEQARLIESTALQAVGMLNLSTELYRVESGHFRLNPEPVKIVDILRHTVQGARSAFAEKHLVLAIDADVAMGKEPPLALGDPMFCYSIFQNLVKNACEAASPASRVSVTLAESDPVCITIENKGVVPVAIRERFFEKFVTSGKVRGTGIGTYSAKLLTEAQGGAIHLEVSDEKNTTTITVTLPRSIHTS